MTPEDLAVRHPRLYHVTEVDSWTSIFQYGLLSTSYLLNLFEIAGEDRAALENQRRATAQIIHHPKHGTITLNDNIPLSDAALASCLDDGLTPSDWYRILNSRVFFWADERGMQRLLNARLNRNRSRDILIVDTLSFVQAHAEHIELSPINSGSTIRRPARRGLQTFTPLLKYSYYDWQRLRGRLDSITEIAVRDGILDIARYTSEVRRMQGEKVIDILWRCQ